MSAIKSVTLKMSSFEGQSATQYTLEYNGGNTATGTASRDFIWQLVSMFYPQEMFAMAQGQADIAAAAAAGQNPTAPATSTPSTGVAAALPVVTVKVGL